jgi:antitoxin (DNA-binding transcriptional repressor) of toxin-antitoxin stability system
MLNVSLQEAKDDLLRLINLVEHGENVFIITNHIKIKLVPVIETTKPRVFGQHRNQATISENFNDPLPNSFWLGETE